MESLVRNHSFLDGNNCTAIASTAISLQMNGYTLAVDPEEMVHFTLACAKGKASLKEIARWFERYGLLLAK
jgi:death-on-curing family protein